MNKTQRNGTVRKGKGSGNGGEFHYAFMIYVCICVCDLCMYVIYFAKRRFGSYHEDKRFSFFFYPGWRQTSVKSTL